MTFLKLTILALTATLAVGQTCENDDWCIHFADATATIDGSSNAIAVSYSDVPNRDGTNKFFESTLMTTDGSSCLELAGSDGSSAGGITIGSIPDPVADSESLTVPMTIDPAAIESGAFATNAVGNTFDIKFCVKTDLMTTVGSDTMAVDSASTVITFTVNKETGFDIQGFAAAPDIATEDTSDVVVNIAVSADFCDTNGAVESVTAKPGQALAFCVSAAAGATIASLKTVFFTTQEAQGVASDTNIPIIDGSGAGVGLSGIDCASIAGQCRVSTVAYARIFEMLDTDGTLVSIYDKAKIAGTAVLNLGGRRVLAKVNFRGSDARELQNDETPVNSFDMDVAGSLETPPERSSAPSAAMAVVSVMMTGLVGLLM